MCARPSFSFCGDRSAAAALSSSSSSGAAGGAASLACCRSLAELGGFFSDAVAIGASFLDGFAIIASRRRRANALGPPGLQNELPSQKRLLAFWAASAVLVGTAVARGQPLDALRRLGLPKKSVMLVSYRTLARSGGVFSRTALLLRLLGLRAAQVVVTTSHKSASPQSCKKRRALHVQQALSLHAIAAVVLRAARRQISS